MHALPQAELKQSLASHWRPFGGGGWLYTMLVHLLSSERGIDLLGLVKSRTYQCDQ